MFKIKKKTVLHTAIRENDIARAKQIIDKGINLNVQDAEGKTPLHISLEQKRYEVVDLLLEKGVQLDLRDFSKKTALHLAIEVNETIAKRIIQKGANLNIRDEFGETPLHTALRLNKIELAKFLIQKGANYRLKDEDGVSAVCLVSKRGYKDLLELIEKKEHDLNVKKDLKLIEYFNNIKHQIDVIANLKLNVPNKSIKTYIEIKMGYDLKEVLNDNVLDDIVKIYNYYMNEGSKAKVSSGKYMPITQKDINKMIKHKPIYIRGISGLSKNNATALSLKHNEVGCDLEFRKLKRKKGEMTRTKFEGTKDGNIKRCFSMINFGKIVPLYEVGYGILEQSIDKIHLVSKRDIASYINKEEGIIEKYEHPIQENNPLQQELKDVFSYLKKTKKGVINNEIIIDVNEQDVRFIYYVSTPQKEGFYRLRAIYLREKYKKHTNKELPIFAYKIGKIKCLKERKISKSEILNLLKDEITKNRQYYKDEFDMFIVFKDKIDKLPAVRKIVQDIILEASRNNNNIYDVINIAKAMEQYFTEQTTKEYLKNVLPAKLDKQDMKNFIRRLTKDSFLYKHKRMNRELDFWLEILSQIKDICDDVTLEAIRPNIHEITKSICSMTLKSNQNKKDKTIVEMSRL